MNARTEVRSSRSSSCQLRCVSAGKARSIKRSAGFKNVGDSSQAARDRSPTKPPAVVSGTVTSDRIRTRAYEIYQARNGNGAAGDAASDWAQAERELYGAAPDPSPSRDVEVKAPARGERLPARGK